MPVPQLTNLCSDEGLGCQDHRPLIFWLVPVIILELEIAIHHSIRYNWMMQLFNWNKRNCISKLHEFHSEMQYFQWYLTMIVVWYNMKRLTKNNLISKVLTSISDSFSVWKHFSFVLVKVCQASATPLLVPSDRVAMVHNNVSARLLLC